MGVVKPQPKPTGVARVCTIQVHLLVARHPLFIIRRITAAVDRAADVHTNVRLCEVVRLRSNTADDLNTR